MFVRFVKLNLLTEQEQREDQQNKKIEVPIEQKREREKMEKNLSYQFVSISFTSQRRKLAQFCFTSFTSVSHLFICSHLIFFLPGEQKIEYLDEKWKIQAATAKRDRKKIWNETFAQNGQFYFILRLWLQIEAMQKSLSAKSWKEWNKSNELAKRDIENYQNAFSWMRRVENLIHFFLSLHTKCWMFIFFPQELLLELSLINYRMKCFTNNIN